MHVRLAGILIASRQHALFHEPRGTVMSITYLVPAYAKPVGGVKVLYQHAQALQAMGVEAEVFHPEQPDFRCTWFDHQARTRLDPVFRPDRDVLVLPEIWALGFGTRFKDAGIPYVIFVQNGHLLSAQQSHAHAQALQEAYLHATCILSISDYTTALIRLAFPWLPPDRIVRQYPRIEARFAPKPKKKIITFMPRKLAHHARHVCFFMPQYLPEGWCMMPIRGKTEQQVADMLAESAMFLSFSEMEGLPLPPLEAAISGNVVVGYTGEGAKEYFQRPVFHEVASAHVLGFVNTIREQIQAVEEGLLASDAFQAALAPLRQDFTGGLESMGLREFAERLGASASTS
jgi:hypothetical protein